MSVIDVHQWLRLDVADRQRRIVDFYASNASDSYHDFLGLVRAARGNGVYASIGPNYQYAIFGRDSIAVAEDIMLVQHGLAKEIILLLAVLQGREFNAASEEEPGKIHHEYRSINFNGHDISKVARTVLERLGPPWGGSADHLLYYGCYDATPLYINLVYRYCHEFGDDILSTSVLCKDNRHRTLREVVRDAATFLAEKVVASPWGLYEFKRLSSAGLLYQSWEDSSVAYLHDDGTTANAEDGIAAIELQGYAYDALHAAAQLVAVDEQEASTWRHLASNIRDNTMERLWMPSERYFCMGMDRTDNGAGRHISTHSANAGLLLASNLFHRMPHQQGWPFVEGIVRMLMSPEFLTIAGLRLRGRSHAKLVGFADYHGSLVTWPKHTYRIAQGMRLHGFYRLADLLEATVLQAIGQAGEFYEFFFVDTHGHPKYHYRHENQGEPTFHDFGAANLPEPGQAWTISAVLNMVNARHNVQPDLPVSSAVRQLEAEILEHRYVQAISEALQASAVLKRGFGSHQ